MSTFARVYATTSFYEAGFLRMALIDHGIACTIENQGAAAYVFGVSTAPLVLTVPEKEAESARQIIGAARRAMSQPPSADTIPLQPVPCSCGRTLEVPEGSVEQTIDCPHCGAAVFVPGAPPVPAGDEIQVFWTGQLVGSFRTNRIVPPDVRGKWENGDAPRTPEFLVELWAGKELPVELHRDGAEPVQGFATMPADSEDLVVRLPA